MKIELDEVCKSCNGTGLYVGMAEHDGAAVVCHTCKGTGCHHFVYEYENFKTRLPPSSTILQVYQCNPGIVIGRGPGFTLADFGGMTFAQWAAGMQFGPGTENRKYTCPAWWYQTADCKKRPKWEECEASLGWSFSKCPYFVNKDECWERWDNEKVGDKP